MPKYSIVIPTYNHCDDLLKPCLESIAKNSPLNEIEVLVVANGCTDNTREHVESLGPPFNLIWIEEAAGYTRATNVGISAAKGEFVVLLNNDTVILGPQWLTLLEEPFWNRPRTGVTGPVKFSWDCGGIKRNAMAFWLVMMRRELFNEIGLLDEVYSPGMGEDGDFCILAEEAGYGLVSVPVNVTGEFETGIKNLGFPIWHKGNGTFADMVNVKDEMIIRNTKILADRYGLGSYFLPKGYKVGEVKYFDDTPNTDEFQREVYQCAKNLVKPGATVLDIGCGSAFKLMSFFGSGYNAVGLDLKPTVEKLRERYPKGKWIEYDLEHPDDSWLGDNYDLVICADVVEHLEDPDKLFALLRKLRFDKLVISTPDRSLIVERGGDRLGPPQNPHHVREWSRREFKRYLENNGMTVEASYVSNVEQATQLAVCTLKHPDVSIIIPTYNHFKDAFKPCIDAVLAATDMSNKEVVVVANGCTDETRTYLESLGSQVRYVWIDEPVGYVRAVNAGIDAANVRMGGRIVLLDNDSLLQPQAKDTWLNILSKGFDTQENVGATSPFANEYEDMGFVLHSGCTMYDADLLRYIGKFDEAFNPGYFSDSDVAMRIWKAGFKCVEVPEDRASKTYTNGVFAIQFPVVHTGQVQTMDKHKDIELVKKNRELLYARHGKKRTPMKKFSIVIPTYNHCDDLLRPCIESIFRYTNADDFEIIVSANGCTDNTREYVEGLIGLWPKLVKLVWSDEALGYTKATNLGIKEASGEYIVLLNNDTELLPQVTNQWLDMMVAPLAAPDVGISGPLVLHDDYADFDVIIFFCAMIKREVFDKVGLLDEVYSPGGGEDIDFTIRAAQAGFKTVATTATQFDPSKATNVGGVPIWHKDNQTFKNIPEYTNHIVKRNGLLNCKRYNKNIRLNLGSGGVPYKGWLSVDLYDKRAHVMMDITKLDFDDNSVTEILASHVFEHLNPYHSIAILQEWRRVLKPGGKLSMEMPDIEALCKRFVTASTGERYGILNAIYGSVNTTGEGGPDNITSPHLFGWWKQSLWDHLSNAGFTNIQFMDEQIPHPESNLRVEAYKPGGEAVKPTPKLENVHPLVDHAWLKAQEPATFIEIFEVDSYKVLESEIRNKTVIDVGANLGMFALRCVELGAKRIIAIEAQPTVFKLGLVENVKRFPTITPMCAAVYDVDGQMMHILNEHVGSKVTSSGDGEATCTVSLKTLVKDIPDDDMVLKLDCEGSEFNILMGADRETVRKFAVIHIEVHADTNENPAYKDVSVVHDRLTELGYNKVSTVPVMWYGTNGETKELGVYVEKWVRV